MQFKKIPAQFPWLTAFAFGVLATTTQAFGAQLDSIISSKTYNLGERKLKSVGFPTNQLTEVTTDHAVAVEYTYGYFRARTLVAQPFPFPPESALTTADQHTVMPSLYWELTPNLPVTAGFSYSHSEQDVPGSGSVHADTYTPFISAHEELLHFFSGFDTRRTALYFGGNFSYSRTEYNFGDNGNNSSDTFDITPSFIFIRSLTDWQDGTPGRFNLTLSPAFGYSYLVVNGPVGSISRRGMISVLGRLDYGLTRNFYLNASATWLHDANEAPSSDFNGYHDWALFGAGFTWKFLQTDSNFWLLKLNYGYMAFYPDVDSHNVSARVEWHF